jgi:flagellin-like protein
MTKKFRAGKKPRKESFMHARQGVSPLIATVLLIAFAVALGAVVMNWGRSYVEDTASNAQRTSQTKVDCSMGVSLEIKEIAGDPKICLDETNNELVVFLQNKGSKAMTGIKTTIIGKDEIIESDTNVTIDKSQVKKFTFTYDASTSGAIDQVIFTPKIDVAGTKLSELCTDAELITEEVLPCSE